MDATPADLGFAMPPAWAPHAATLMAWPCRVALWEDQLEAAKDEFAAVARAIAAFEPVLMACPPGTAADVSRRVGPTEHGVEPLEIPIDDSWARDSGPVCVVDREGRVAAVGFTFNAWGRRWEPYADDARLPERVAAHLGMRLFHAPMVLEGGAIEVDGEGTLLTTEQCLLNPNRNPAMGREAIEQTLRAYLGAERVVWLPFGQETDCGPAGTDGHIDGVAAFLAPGRVLLDVREDPASPEHRASRANLAALRDARDARGRPIEVVAFDPGPFATVPYANHYLVNGGVIVPLGGDAAGDAAALEALAAAYPGRELVGVPARVLDAGGGGPHCITSPIPAGPVAAP
ncbi:MAG: agmatine deiminase family protein [Chloroflexota bacterium]